MPFISLLLFGLAVYVVHHQIAGYGWNNVWQDLLSTPAKTLETMLLMSVFGYITLSLCEWVAVRYSEEILSFPFILLGSFLSNAISHNLGASPITGGAIRYRFYSQWGLTSGAIAKITVFGSLSYFLSAFSLLLIGRVVAPDFTVTESGLVRHAINLLTAVGVCFLAGWAYVTFLRQGRITIGRISFLAPSPSLAIQQITLGAIDLTIAAIVLYIPLLHFADIAFSEFIVYYVVAQLLGLISQVPGGIGVFESGFLLLAGHRFPPEQLLSALIIYRIAYYILPLILAGVLIAAYETRSHRLIYTLRIHHLFRLFYLATPKIFAAMLLVGGCVLLVSGATPGVQERLDWLAFFVPLPLIEFSHLVNSLVGVGMIFLSRAVSIKLDSAYYATIILLCVGIVASLAKGWDFEEAFILAAMLLAFIPARRHFYRKSALLKMAIPINQLLFGVLIIGLSIWLGFYSYKDVSYSHELWLQSSLDRAGDASRFLRSLFAISVVCVGLLVYRMVSRTVTNLSLPTKAELEAATTIVHNSDTTDHHLVLTGDKYIFWSETRRSFLMFGVTSKFWIAMSDPVGDAAEFDDLLWRFRESADMVAAQIAFYEIGKNYIPLYLDLGLSLIKLGQQAQIPLAAFGLEGKKRQNFRSAINKYHREGFSFEILRDDEVEPALPNLRRISDAWLAEKNASEKRFSMGFFSEEYLRHCDIAVVKKDGEIYAFCNLWTLNNRRQISFDLMRYLPGTPNGIMEYLSISVALWAKEQGFAYFSLGMAPLSGLEDHALAPLWHKIGNTIFKVGGDFYNFAGVYFYKDKFNPQWNPVYLAAPPGLQTAAALVAATSLISGGITGIFSK
ncbi:MAG: bifunctional lysylphosphatidylglycerol flippase/synthetase MprF [Halioglobus sp.]